MSWIFNTKQAEPFRSSRQAEAAGAAQGIFQHHKFVDDYERVIAENRELVADVWRMQEQCGSGRSNHVCSHSGRFDFDSIDVIENVKVAMRDIK